MLVMLVATCVCMYLCHVTSSQQPRHTRPRIDQAHGGLDVDDQARDPDGRFCTSACTRASAMKVFGAGWGNYCIVTTTCVACNLIANGALRVSCYVWQVGENTDPRSSIV